MRLAKKWRRALGRATLSLGVAALLAVTGCGDGKIRRYPVSGSVNVDGKAAEGAVVIFCPVDANPEVENLRPAGKTDASGKFQLITVDPGDGAPAGKYKVLVHWPAPAKATTDDRGGRGTSQGSDRLRGKYYNLDKTPFSVTVEERSNELAPFELQSK